MNNIFSKKKSLNISYNYNNNFRYDSNFNDLDNYINLFLSDLNTNNKNNFYIIQIVTSIWLADEILRYKNKEKKEKYMKSETYEQRSKLDKLIIDERIWFFYNDNCKYTKEFNDELDNSVNYYKENNIEYKYDDVYDSIFNKYRNKKILELNISENEIEKWTSTKMITNWTRKFEIPLDNWEIIHFDYRNSLTTIFCYWNYKEWYNILWVWWGGSSFQRQTFTEMSYVIQNVLNKTNWNILKTDLFYYNEYNEIETIKEWINNKFYLNYDLWSNSDILYNNKNIREQLDYYMPHIESDFFNDEKAIYDYKYIPYEISLWEFIDIWLLYIYENIDLNKTYLYFWDKINAYWDDWNDSPSDCNSWTPYSEFVSSIIEFEWLLSAYINLSDNNSNKCMDYIKDKKLELYKWINYWDDKIKTVLKIKEYWNINKIY